MSRRMPPTPVAAPWYGSTADGWLWLSILNATARPSPIAITPACSPMPATTSSPFVGSVLSSGPAALVRAVLAPHDAEHRELEAVRLAAQLLADRLELDVGEPQRAVERDGLGGHAAPPATGWPSAPVACPRSARSRAPLGGAHHQRADDPEAVVAAQDRLDRRLRVRHQPGHVAGGVAHARDPAQGAVGVARVVGPGDGAVGVGVPPQHAAVALQRVERRLVRVVAALAVGDGHAQRAALARSRA